MPSPVAAGCLRRCLDLRCRCHCCPRFAASEGERARRRARRRARCERYSAKIDLGLGLHVFEDASRCSRDRTRKSAKAWTGHVRGELRAGVAVEELRHLERGGDRLERPSSAAGVKIDWSMSVAAADHARVLRQVRLLRRRGAEVVEELLGGFGVLRDRRPSSSRRSAPRSCRCRTPGSSPARGRSRGRRCRRSGNDLADEVADGHHAGFSVDEGGRGLLPRPPVGVLLVAAAAAPPTR